MSKQNQWKPYKSAGEVISKIGKQKTPEKSKHYHLYQLALVEQNKAVVNETNPSNITSNPEDALKIKTIDQTIDEIIAENKDKFQVLEVDRAKCTTRILCRGNENLELSFELSRKLAQLLSERDFLSLSKQEQKDILAYREDNKEIDKLFNESNFGVYNKEEDIAELSSHLNKYDEDSISDLLKNPIKELFSIEQALEDDEYSSLEERSLHRDLEKIEDLSKAFLALMVKYQPGVFKSNHQQVENPKMETVKRYLCLTEQERDTIKSYLSDSIKKNDYNISANYDYIRSVLRQLPAREQGEHVKVLNKLFYPLHIKGSSTKRKLLDIFG